MPKDSGYRWVYTGASPTPAKNKSSVTQRQTEPLIYEVQVTLTQIEPSIWRRFTVPASIHLDQFHEALLAVMGWFGGHLYEFRVRGESYGDPDTLGDPAVAPDSAMMLAHAVHRRKGTFYYVYDWGDEWWHQIKLWDYRPMAPNETVPTLLDGARACPPEDVGGVWGYTEFLEAVQDPTHPEHDEMLNWVGEDWDPEHFDRALLQRRLTAAAQRGAWNILLADNN